MDSQSHGKIGRNDPCSCGSGKKYKHCCLQSKPISEESLWARQHDASEQLTREIVKYAEREFGDRVHEAWEDFNLDEVEGVYEENPDEDMIFMPYFLFCWDPSGAARKRKGTTPSGGGVVARSFLVEKGKLLSELQRQVLDQATTQPISFYEVLSSEPGVQIALRDVLTGWKTLVTERMASELLESGDILYAQVLSLPGIAVLGCCAPIRIPPVWKPDVISLRAWLRKRVARQHRELGAEDLVRYADEIRDLYLSFRSFSNRPPELQNTDGDPLVLHTLTYRIESAEAALEALAPLAGERSHAKLLEEAEFDEAGKIRNVEFSWTKKGNRKFKT
jgi:hypothetical protein